MSGVLTWTYDQDADEWKPVKLHTFYSISSDKDTHFYGALAQYAKEDENITGLVGDKIRITGVSIQGDEDLDFYLMFWNTDDFENTDMDVDDFCSMVHLDMSSNAIRIGAANQYYYALDDLAIDYEDEDGTQELHVSLYCADAAGKTAAAAGEVAIQIRYELRE